MHLHFLPSQAIICAAPGMSAALPRTSPDPSHNLYLKDST
jgi:hypothetical protein